MGDLKSSNCYFWFTGAGSPSSSFWKGPSSGMDSLLTCRWSSTTVILIWPRKCALVSLLMGPRRRALIRPHPCDPSFHYNCSRRTYCLGHIGNWDFHNTNFRGLSSPVWYFHLIGMTWYNSSWKGKKWVCSIPILYLPSCIVVWLLNYLTFFFFTLCFLPSYTIEFIDFNITFQNVIRQNPHCLHYDIWCMHVLQSTSSFMAPTYNLSILPNLVIHFPEQASSSDDWWITLPGPPTAQIMYPWNYA